MRKLLEKLGLIRETNKQVKHTNPNMIFQEVSNRMMLFGLAIVLAMLLVFGKVFQVQVLKHDHYTEALENYTMRYQTITTPRGEMLDRKGKKVVSNKIVKSIIYYPPSGVKTDEQWELAQKFAENFKVDETNLNTSDLNDMYIFLNREDVYGRVPDDVKEKYKQGGYTEAEYYNIVKNLVTDEDISKLSAQQRKAYLVYQAMTLPTAGSMKTIIADTTNQEIAYLAEHNLEYPGFQSFSGWDRDYVVDAGLKSLAGRISTEKQGVPAEDLDYYLAKGYSRDEKVGRSGIEAYYEDLLSGNRIVQDVQYTEDGFANPKDIKEGTKGFNLNMAIDADLQEFTEKTMTKYIEENKNHPNRKFMDNGYIVVSKPKTGEVLALVAMKTSNDGTLYNDPSATYLDALEPGSVIKGSMVYLGLDSGVVSPGEQILETPIKIQGTEPKSSYTKMSVNDDESALARSSNVYMMHIAMRVAEAVYKYDEPLYGVDLDDFNKLRENYSRFGLGVSTGLDVPTESLGYVGDSDTSGLLLDYSMGQYDTYTPMQVSQYINTIANGGYRIAPKLVNGASDPITGNVVYENKTKILGTLENKEALGRVQEGFRGCVTYGLCQQNLNTLSHDVAAKTGTAEATTVRDGVTYDSLHSWLAAYAPYDDPEISIVVAVRDSMNDVVVENITQPIAADIFNYYFDNKNK